MEGIINWFSRNHVAANFLMALILIAGVLTWPKVRKEIFPETAIDAVMVGVPFPNATPEEVEKGVIVPIEEAILNLEGIDTIRSIASQGLAKVIVFAAVGYDVRDLMADIQTRIDAITNLAEEAEEPMLEQLVLKNQVLSLALSANTTEASLRELGEEIRSSLLNYDGGPCRITQVNLAGIRDYEISIEISEEKLQQYGLTFDQVATAIRRSSLDMPGGSLRTSTGEVLIRTEARKYNAMEFSAITVFKRPDGSEVKMDQIAFVRDGFKEGELENRFNGEPAILINVLRVGNEDTLKVAESVKQWVKELAPEILPPGVTLQVWRDDSLFLKGRLEMLINNGIAGLILVALLLAMFLRPSLAFLVALGIPVSFCGAVIMMPYTDISINLISLFAFILVLGIVVDDAIVVGENVYRRMRLGEDPREAAPKGTHEVGVVVIFGVLTTIMAFTPMLGLSGLSGKIWPNIPLVVIPTLIFSLIQSKLMLPAHLAMLKPYDPNRQKGPILRFQDFFARGLERFVDVAYRPVLSACLNFRWVVLAVFVCLLIIVGAYVGNGHIRFRFLPTVEGDIISVRVELAEGVPFQQTREAVQLIAKAGLELGAEFKDNEGKPIVTNVLASAGSQPFVIGFEGVGGVPVANNIGEVTIELRPAAVRKWNTDQIISRWRDNVGSIPGVVSLVYRTETASGGNAIEIEISGLNLEDLRAGTEELKQDLNQIEGVIDINDDDKEGKRELKLEILPAAEALGLTLGDVANQVRQGFFGEEIQRLQRGKSEVVVYVRYPRDNRKSLSDLSNIKIRTQRGDEVPFSQVATASFGRATSTIQRTDGQRAIRVTADVDKAKGANANEVVASLNRGRESYWDQWRSNFFNRVTGMFGKETELTVDGPLKRIEEQYPGVRVGFKGEQRDQAESISELKSRFILAIIGMYVLLAIPLRSYLQPMIIMAVIPFGIIGAVIGHVVMGYDFSVMSMCGIIALSGVVVNDSLVLVEYINREREKGGSILRAAYEAGATRFRPILLTSITTFGGLTPMLMATDLQARFLIPMAISLSYGILFATAITLILVPCIYLMMSDVKKFLKYAFS